MGNQTTGTTAQIPQQSSTCPATLYDQEGNDQTSLLQASGGFYNINLQPADSSPANKPGDFALVGGPAYFLVETPCTQPTPTASAQISGSGIEVVFQYPFDESNQLVVQRQKSDPLLLPLHRLHAAVPMNTIIQPWLGIITIPIVPRHNIPISIRSSYLVTNIVIAAIYIKMDLMSVHPIGLYHTRGFHLSLRHPERQHHPGCDLTA